MTTEEDIDLPIVVHEDDDFAKLDQKSDRAATQPKRRFAFMVVALIVMGVWIRIGPFAWMESEELPDGTVITVFNVWSKTINCAYGEPPDWQYRSNPDGSVEYGPMLNGLRHGDWKREDGPGPTVVTSYRFGEKTPKKPDDKGHQE